MYRLRRRTGDTTAPGSRRRISYANVTATLALIAAIGGGTAWASTNHWKITRLGQIKPSVREALRGHNGTNRTNGATGARGATGATGTAGATGPTGPTGMPGIATGSSAVTASAIQSAVVDAVATTTGNQLVTAQIAASRAGPQTIGDAVGCTIVNVTAAPGTDLDQVSVSFPIENASTASNVDFPLQAVVAAHAGDTIAVECVGGSLGFAVPQASIALIPEN